jgi:hypothetical protein
VRNLKTLILLSDSARWPATPAHPCNTLTQRGLSSQIFESIFNCILKKSLFGPPKLLSENRFCGLNSIGRSSERENPGSSSYEKIATKSAINCQSKQSLQFSPIEPKYNYFNFGAPQFSGTACMEPSFLCPPWLNVSLYIHTIAEYSFQPQNLF